MADGPSDVRDLREADEVPGGGGGDRGARARRRVRDGLPACTGTVADVLAGNAKAKAATHDGILPATPILAEIERGLSGKIGRELVLRKALKDARKQHDLIRKSMRELQPA